MVKKKDFFSLGGLESKDIDGMIYSLNSLYLIMKTNKILL